MHRARRTVRGIVAAAGLGGPVVHGASLAPREGVDSVGRQQRALRPRAHVLEGVLEVARGVLLVHAGHARIVLVLVRAAFRGQHLQLSKLLPEPDQA